ncbi:translesion DNA synthesis-associated protein ImuA [Ferrimonas lipolytica]|uniref:Translesion DNA synthesis-associated protein ImuA n=1 Tax=Ferrimonas lipolytica TaxID=2724191 RepID=A0A6H1UAU0_9GAMM|nr:translesion DNA synthesis-associated protein ImuA [Ferrimonas lipolytica]QIZ76185.1 translesion DNA synthesis-associated protein ImuA [Ferrimonas lipolytica]
MAARVSTLFNRNDIWLGKQWQQQEQGISSGYAALDKQLAGGGWPQVGLVELLGDSVGIGALLQPLLKQKQQQDRWQMCIAPPAQPHAPAWAAAGVELTRMVWIDSPCRKEQLWTLEHSLNSGCCSLILAWLDELSPTEARRLQLAAKKGQCLLLLHLPEAVVAQPHAVALRLLVQPNRYGCDVRIIKQRGGWPQSDLALGLPHRPKPLPPQSSPMSAAVTHGPW